MAVFIPVPEFPGYFREQSSIAARERIDEARERNLSRNSGEYFVVGRLPVHQGYHFFRVETGAPLQMLVDFEVGIKALYKNHRDVREKVLTEMTLVHAENPIVPHFADEGGFHCAFERPVDQAFGEFLDRTITEGWEGYMDDFAISPRAIRENCLELWWD